MIKYKELKNLPYEYYIMNGRKSTNYNNATILIGHRTGNFYYGTMAKNGQVSMRLSRYLPWGETNTGQCHNGHVYPKKPNKIPRWLFYVLLHFKRLRGE